MSGSVPRDPAREVPPAMATKGLGWSGRERPSPPPAGPGMRRPGPAEPDGRCRDPGDPMRDVPDDLVVDVPAPDPAVEQALAELDRDLVGLREVKARIREIAALLVVDRLRRRLNLEAEPPTLHMCFTGNPGTGKTTVARRMGRILHALGYVRKGHLVVASRDDLVGQYVGHTAPKTREVIRRAMGGVLFIDEAYHLYRVDNERDYGQETVEILLEVMEQQRGDLVVIMAGYKDRMDRFFADVPGLSSRIAHHIDFPDYDLGELLQIARLMLERQRYRLAPDAEVALEAYLRERMRQPRFANGRSVRNAVDRARLRHAVRLYEDARGGRRLTKGDLVTIQAEDILASRVFSGGAYAAAGQAPSRT